ncbi:4-fold beta flower protein [Aneurinibacillus terranovensis]|uniref:4-fold beta flower protein n=1 Tax=Aneurinibacillus terranovensis TaxID=278991 RepID=UPI000487655C|nr:hypothetical protein [Aneurinibacillus terranovensis]
MSETTFYNKRGEPIAYTQDGEHIYLFNGKPVAYLYQNSVYTYSGKHLGVYENGWIRDNNGQCVFFTSEATGGPMKPMKQMKPMKNLKQLKPLKSLKQIKPARAMNSSQWSELSSGIFFDV